MCPSSLVAILAQWIAYRVVLWSVGYAKPIPFHLENFMCLKEPNSIYWLCGELYCVSWMGQVTGDEWYDCVILKEFINIVVILGCIVWCWLLGCVFFGFSWGV